MKPTSLVLAFLLAALGTPLLTGTAAAKPLRIGRLAPNTAANDTAHIDGFRQGLRDLGWVEGSDFTIEGRYAEGQPDRLPAMAAELVRLRVDLILAGSTIGARAARDATRTIPIVVVTQGDPVAGGLVPSLSHPGGNLTGVTALSQVLGAKRLELLKEAVPGMARVAVLMNPASPDNGPFLKERDAVARALRLHVGTVEVRSPATLDQAFATMTGDRADGLMVMADLVLITHRRRIAELAARNRLPAVYNDRTFVEAGGLLFYGASLRAMYQQAARHADRILKKGARPADLPFEQPTTLEMVVNLKAAKALGLAISPSVLARADHLIE